MVHLESFQEMKSYWIAHRDSILKKYSGGYVVIDYSPTMHHHFQTHEEMFKRFPILKRLSEGECVLGTAPLYYNVSDELWKERDQQRDEDNLKLLDLLHDKQGSWPIEDFERSLSGVFRTK